MKVLDGTIVTFTGELFCPLDPDPSKINIEDVAHALANSCRFTGHVRKFYSVAQHSVLCSMLVPNELRLTALLHDASEAYLSDVARPIKHASDGTFGLMYREVEDRLEQAIAERFGTEYPKPEAVDWADKVMLRSEQRDLMPNLLRWEGDDYLDYVIDPWEPDHAKGAFLSTFHAVS